MVVKEVAGMIITLSLQLLYYTSLYYIRSSRKGVHLAVQTETLIVYSDLCMPIFVHGTGLFLYLPTIIGCLSYGNPLLHAEANIIRGLTLLEPLNFEFLVYNQVYST